MPGAGDPRTSGGCRHGTCSACQRDHSPDRRSAARRAGLDAWLAGRARDTGILSRIRRATRRNIPLEPALSAGRQRDRKSERLPRPPPQYAESEAVGRCRAPGHPGSWPAVSWTRAPSIEHPAGLIRGILTWHRLADDCPHNSEGHVSGSDIVTGTHTGYVHPIRRRRQGRAPAARETTQHRSFGNTIFEFSERTGFYAPARPGAHTGRAVGGIRA